LADYGVSPIPGLKHVCGHYELGPNGELIARDLFSTTMSPQLLKQAVDIAQSSADRALIRARSVSLQISDYSVDQLPKACRKGALDPSQGLLVASRQL
jgi:hypothetical protein